jgi:hypothetical protein
MLAALFVCIDCRTQPQPGLLVLRVLLQELRQRRASLCLASCLRGGDAFEEKVVGFQVISLVIALFLRHATCTLPSCGIWERRGHDAHRY